jgi:hypothetical protein
MLHPESMQAKRLSRLMPHMSTMKDTRCGKTAIVGQIVLDGRPFTRVVIGNNVVHLRGAVPTWEAIHEALGSPA